MDWIFYREFRYDVATLARFCDAPKIYLVSEKSQRSIFLPKNEVVEHFEDVEVHGIGCKNGSPAILVSLDFDDSGQVIR